MTHVRWYVWMRFRLPELLATQVRLQWRAPALFRDQLQYEYVDSQFILTVFSVQI